MANKNKQEFNLVVTGVGGQGLITLLKIVSLAAMSEGKEIRTSELHGLAQRGGSVEVHIRFGKDIFSPLVPKGKADLVLSLESQEAINGLPYAEENTIFIVNKYQTPTFATDLSADEVLKNIQRYAKNVLMIPASEFCKKELGNEVVSGIYLLGFAASKQFLGLQTESVVLAIKQIVPEKYLDLNIRAFELAKTSF